MYTVSYRWKFPCPLPSENNSFFFSGHSVNDITVGKIASHGIPNCQGKKKIKIKIGSVQVTLGRGGGERGGRGGADQRLQAEGRNVVGPAVSLSSGSGWGSGSVCPLTCRAIIIIFPFFLRTITAPPSRIPLVDN